MFTCLSQILCQWIIIYSLKGHWIKVNALMAIIVIAVNMFSAHVIYNVWIVTVFPNVLSVIWVTQN